MQHRTNAITERALKHGLLEDMPHFSCTYYPELGPNGDGQSVLHFADFCPHQVTLRFIFRGNGDILLSGCPNQWSTFRPADIFAGQSDSAGLNLFDFTMNSIPSIKQTLNLYTSSIPHEDYSPLLDLWSHVHPKLMDSRIEPHMPHPWWKIW